MTDSETKAKAWESADDELFWSSPADGDWSRFDEHRQHIWSVIVPHMRRQAERIRDGAKAKWERKKDA